MRDVRFVVLMLGALLLVGCGNDNGAPSKAATISASPAQEISKWDRELKTDPFDDKKKTLSFTNTAEQGGGYLLLMCEENALKFFWQYALSGKSPFAGMTMEVALRIDNEPPFNEEWGWSAAQPLMYPKGDKVVFLDKLAGKQKFAIKSVVADASYGVFNIAGFDKAYSEVKSLCGK